MSYMPPGVLPGSYTVIAIENGWDLDWGKPAVLAQYTKHGQTITVGSRARGAMQLPDPVEVQLNNVCPTDGDQKRWTAKSAKLAGFAAL